MKRKNKLFIGIGLLALLLSTVLLYAETLKGRFAAIEQYYLVQLREGVAFHWDNENAQIVHDSLYAQVLERYEEYKMGLVEQILDTTPIPAKTCGFNERLRKGDMALLLIDEVERLPYMPVFQVQWCQYVIGCPYPISMMNYVHNFRAEAKAKVGLYLLTQQKNQARSPHS